METFEVEEKVYKALKNNGTLTGLLAKADKSIFYMKAPAVNPDLPYLVYSPLSDVPILFGDNSEKLHRVIIRIHIVSGENNYAPLYSEIKNVMQALGFTREQTMPRYSQNGVRMLITDFKKIIGA